jgi:DNA-binding transcriptional LysR family regulator
LSKVDLNLFVIFAAVLVEGSVTRASARLGLSQPAVSNALGRLRDLLGDPLFIKTSVGMEPTTYARSIAGRVQTAIEEVGDILQPQHPFDCRSSKREFSIGMSDHVASFLAPVLVRTFYTEAPSIEIVIKNANHLTATEMIDRGDIELAVVGKVPNLPLRMQECDFLDETLICAARAGHPAFGTELTVEAYLAHKHLHFSAWGEKNGYIDEVLAKTGLRRTITVTVAHLLVVPAILEQTDLIATAPARVLRPMAKSWNLALADPPFAVTLRPLAQLWHRRVGNDSGHRWLRSQIDSLAHRFSA